MNKNKLNDNMSTIEETFEFYKDFEVSQQRLKLFTTFESKTKGIEKLENPIMIFNKEPTEVFKPKIIEYKKNNTNNINSIF